MSYGKTALANSKYLVPAGITAANMYPYFFPTTGRTNPLPPAGYVSGGLGSSAISMPKRRKLGKRSWLTRKMRNLETVQHLGYSDSTLTVALLHNTLYDHNVTYQIKQGTAGNKRIGDQIYLEAIKIRAHYGSNTSQTNGQIIRVIVGYCEQNSNSSGWGTNFTNTSIFVQSSGTTSYANGVPDPKEITVLYDEAQTVSNQVSGVSDVTQFVATVPIQKSFPYYAETDYGKNKNLYIWVMGSTLGGVVGSTNVGSIYMSYDVMWRNSK